MEMLTLWGCLNERVVGCLTGCTVLRGRLTPPDETDAPTRGLLSVLESACCPSCCSLSARSRTGNSEIIFYFVLISFVPFIFCTVSWGSLRVQFLSVTDYERLLIKVITIPASLSEATLNFFLLVFGYLNVSRDKIHSSSFLNMGLSRRYLPYSGAKATQIYFRRCSA